VLKQVAAVNGALKSLGRVILDSHLRGCVSEAMRSDRRSDRLIDEVMEVFDKFSS